MVKGTRICPSAVSYTHLDVYKRQLAHLAVHADIQITCLAHLLEKFFVMSLAGTYQRGKHKYILTLIIPVNQADDLFLGIFPVSYTHLDVYKRQE